MTVPPSSERLLKLISSSPKAADSLDLGRLINVYDTYLDDYVVHRNRKKKKMTIQYEYDISCNERVAISFFNRKFLLIWPFLIE